MFSKASTEHYYYFQANKSSNNSMYIYTNCQHEWQYLDSSKGKVLRIIYCIEI